MLFFHFKTYSEIFMKLPVEDSFSIIAASVAVDGLRI